MYAELYKSEILRALCNSDDLFEESKKNGLSAEELNTVFKMFYTVKASAEFFGLEDISIFSREVAAKLKTLRNKQKGVTPETAHILDKAKCFICESLESEHSMERHKALLKEVKSIN